MPSETYRQEAYAQNSGAVEIDLIRVHLDSETRYYARAYDAVISAGITYQPAQFELPLPSDSGDQSQQSTLTIDAIDRQVITILRSQHDPIEIEHEIVLAEDPDVVEMGPLLYEVVDSTWDVSSARLSLSFDPILNEPAPYGRFTPTTSPGLFR